MTALYKFCNHESFSVFLDDDDGDDSMRAGNEWWDDEDDSVRARIE